MSPYIKKVALETGKPIEEVEKHWQESKDIAAETLGKVEKNFTNEDFQYAIGILKSKMGIHDNIHIKDFVDSDQSAKSYIETVTSSQFSIGKIIPPIAKRKDLDNEDDELPGQQKEDLDPPVNIPAVINLSPSNTKALLKCEECGHRFLGREGDQCPECKSIQSKSLSEVKTRRETVNEPELDDETIHTDTKGPENDGGGAQHVGEEDTRTEQEKKMDEAIDKEFAFLGPARSAPKLNKTTGKVELPKSRIPSKVEKVEKPTKERVKEIIAQKREEEENDDVDLDSLKEFLNMVNLDKETQK